MMNSRKDSHRDFLRSQGVIQRRKRKQRIARAIRLALALLLIGSLFYSMWLDQLAIHSVVVVGTDPDLSAEIVASATASLQGTYAHLIPRHNALFYPKKTIEADILSGHPKILSASVSTEGFDILNIQVTERQPVMRWCSSANGACYLLDNQAFVYATATPEAIDEITMAGLEDSPSTDTEAPAASSSITNTAQNANGKRGAKASTRGILAMASTTASSSIAAAAPVAPAPVFQPAAASDASALPSLLTVIGGPLSTSTDPIGQTAFGSQDFRTMYYLATELASSSLTVASMKYEDPYTIDFNIVNNGEIILSGKNDPGESIGNVLAALESSVFSTSTKFQYIDARFGNKVFYRLAQ